MLLRVLRRLARDKKGQGMVEYALIVAGVAVVCAVSISVLGHKTADVIAIAAAVMPGAVDTDNAPINTSSVMPTKLDSNGDIVMDPTKLVAASGTPRWDNVFAGGAASLVNDPGN
jgi:Flp pilus assembly pilin Flp